MTNEEKIREKARELAIKYCKDIDPHGKEVYNIGCEIACCEITAWKEQQMIKKAIEWINIHMLYNASESYKKELIEDLKKYMEES